MELRDLAIAYRASLANYAKAFRRHFQESVTVLADDRFWTLQGVFRTEVCKFRFNCGGSNGVEQAAQELFRKPLAGDFDDNPTYMLEEAIQFAKTWPSIHNRLYRPLFDVVQDRGDDAYGDLLDALPLAGREVVEKAVGGGLANEQQFEAAVLEGCAADERLATFILHGENYVAMSLADAARDAFAGDAWSQAERKVEATGNAELLPNRLTDVVRR
jgi:hypothetical protein